MERQEGERAGCGCAYTHAPICHSSSIRLLAFFFGARPYSCISHGEPSVSRLRDRAVVFCRGCGVKHVWHNTLHTCKPYMFRSLDFLTFYPCTVYCSSFLFPHTQSPIHVHTHGLSLLQLTLLHTLLRTAAAAAAATQPLTRDPLLLLVFPSTHIASRFCLSTDIFQRYLTSASLKAARRGTNCRLPRNGLIRGTG